MPRRVAAVVEQCWHRVPGGTAASTVRSLGALADRDDWEVVGVAARHGRPAPDALSVDFDVRHLPLPRLALYEAWHRLRRPSVERFTGPVDVVHATGGVVPPGGPGALVVTVHDLAFLHRPQHFTRRGVSFMRRSFELAREEAAVIVVPSEVTAADCEAQGIDRGRIRVIPWGVEVAEIDDRQRDEVRRRLGLPDRFVLWVGTAEPRKNVDRLIAAHAAAETGLPLILAGPDGWGLDLATLIPTGADVRHIGELSAGDLPVVFDLADIFAFPSLLEGFGMPVLEAMAQGTAVITSRGTATEEVAGSAARLVDPESEQAIAGALAALVSDDARRSELGEAGRRRAATMSWDATAAALAAVYEEAAS